MSPTVPAAPLDDDDRDDRFDMVDMFDLAPVSLWIEDCSRLRLLMDRWRADGITDLRAHLTADAARVVDCAAGIRVVRVNRRTLELYGATDRDHLVANLHLVLRDDMHDHLIDGLVHLWEGRSRFTVQSVNYSLQGARIDICLHAQVLPGCEHDWRCVLISIDDLTERVAVQRALGHSEAYARALFEHSPVSLWVEDYSGVKRLFDAARASGVADLRAWLQADPDFVQQCSRAIRVLDVNRRTLDMFGAADKASLVDALPTILGGPMQSQFADHLLDLWDGMTMQQREVEHRSVGGTPIDVWMQVAVLPGHAHDWSLVLVSLVDVTARKRAEADLEYLSTHDSLTGLRNRSFFAAELRRLERSGPWPVALIVFDLNGLKPVNDHHGHAAGDRLIRRAGDVLGAALASTLVSDGVVPGHAARLGGDEFALVLPGADAAAAARVRQSVRAQVEIDNAMSDEPPLSFSSGTAMLLQGQSADAALHLADERMYGDKRAHYASRGIDRRGDLRTLSSRD